MPQFALGKLACPQHFRRAMSPHIGRTNTTGVVREGLVPNPKLRLRDQLREVMRFKHYSRRTEEAYWGWIRRFLLFCRDHPRLTPAETKNHPTLGPSPHPMRRGELAAEREKRWRHPRELGNDQ